MHQLIANKKGVGVAYITSGDAGVNASSREDEILSSMQAIGINKENIHLLRFPEKAVLSSFGEISDSLRKLAQSLKPDCIVGMDYEGGHEGHDSASFLTYKLAQSLKTEHFVFSVYHSRNNQRYAGDFLPTHKATDVIKLSTDDIGIKIKVLEAHRGQIGHFLHLQRLNPEYFKLIFSREVFMKVKEQLDYSKKPTDEIGYESHSNGFKYENFKKAVRTLDE
jgi:LmbE family N-acetylglucosaminyl deacetylase